MRKIWNIKIRSSIKKEFPSDPMMQELHEIRARLAKKYKSIRKIKESRGKIGQLSFGTFRLG